MKSKLSSVATVFTLTIMAATAATATAFSAHASDIACFSAKTAPVYYSNSGQWILKLDAGQSQDEIINVNLSTKAEDQAGGTAEALTADSKFKPKNPKYADYQRFGLSDLWCDYQILLPKDLATADAKFHAQIYFLCDGGSGGNFSLLCLKK
jgi:hypothetical protein